MEAEIRHPHLRQLPSLPSIRLSPRIVSALIYAASIVVFFAAWQLFAAYIYQSVLFPTPLETARTFARLAVTDLPSDIEVSFGRVITGFAIGGVVGTILGLAMGSYAPIRSLFEPYVHFLRFIPPIAWFTPAVIWFGIGEESKVFLITYTTTFVVLLNTMAGVEAVPIKRVLVARMFGASPLQKFLRITLPSSLSYIFIGLRLASGNAFMTMVAAEMLGANQGVGFLIINARLWSGRHRPGVLWHVCTWIAWGTRRILLSAGRSAVGAGDTCLNTKTSNRLTHRNRRLPDSRKGTEWRHILQTLVCYRLIDPGSEWRLCRVAENEWKSAPSLPLLPLMPEFVDQRFRILRQYPESADGWWASG